MKKLMLGTILALLCVESVWAQSETEQTLARIAQKADGVLAAIRITGMQGGQSGEAVGLAVCIDSKGLFMTLSFPQTLEPADIQKIELLPAGAGHEVYPAELVGIDRTSGLSFVQAQGGTWTPVQFAPSADLKMGQQVISAGLLINPATRPVSVGLAYISSIMEVPNKLVYVTGGTLTGIGSLVFTADGRAVGLVGPQLFLKSRMQTNSGVATVSVQGQQRTSFFTAIDEYAHVLGNIPSGGSVRKLPWLGIGTMEAVDEAIALVRGLDKPGIIVERVFPGHPAAEAGIKDQDIIVAFNGKDLVDYGDAQMNVGALRRQLARCAPGQTVEIAVLQSGDQTYTATVTLAEPPKLPGEAKSHRSLTMGMFLREKVDLDKHLQTGPAAAEAGLLAVAVAPGGPADVAGLQAGDLVTHTNAEPVTTIAQFEEIVARGGPTDPVSLTIRRSSESLDIRIFPRVR